MYVVHSCGWYFPENHFGTETYVAALIRALRPLNIRSAVVVPTEGHIAKEYTHEDTRVFRYPIGVQPSIAQLRSLRPHDHFESFEAWLNEQRPDVYHQHSWTYGCGLAHLQSAKKLGLPTV